MKNYFNLNLKTEFETRIIKEDLADIDLFIDLNYKTLNLDIEDNKYSRLQFNKVRGIIIRLTKSNTIATIHILRDIDLYSSFCNFELNYKNFNLYIYNNNNSCDFILK
ncbi:MAG: hypothetical protein N4A54_02410 [Peptostreptococcaceae bacterium]|jgi:hypothetical protein|nr:hypothetical protein [Peptostreptococcaceae bacterium]